MQYYEATIQIRPRSHDVEKFVDLSLRKTDKAQIAKRKVLKEGVDYYISSWKFGVALGNMLTKNFAGELKISRKIFGRSRDKGKIVYRSVVSFRVWPFRRGDIVASDHKLVLIKSVGKVVTGENLIRGKREKIDVKSGWEKLEKHNVVVSKDYPSLEVISPEDYQSIAVENAKNKVGKKNRNRLV